MALGVGWSPPSGSTGWDDLRKQVLPLCLPLLIRQNNPGNRVIDIQSLDLSLLSLLLKQPPCLSPFQHCGCHEPLNLQLLQPSLRCLAHLLLLLKIHILFRVVLALLLLRNACRFQPACCSMIQGCSQVLAACCFMVHVGCHSQVLARCFIFNKKLKMLFVWLVNSIHIACYC